MQTVLKGKGITTVIGPDVPFTIIGERINPTGRQVFSDELKAGNFDRAVRDAIAQDQAGAGALDVNAGVPGTDESAFLIKMVQLIQEVTDLPLVLDSGGDEAIEAAIEHYQGKPLINSTTGEDERMERTLPMVAKYGAAVIGMANDDRGITMDPKIRLEAAKKIVGRAGEYGIPPEDIIIDPLAMTVGADPQAAQIFLTTCEMIRDELGVNMTCGASNISFGLPGRNAIAGAFLPMAIQAGLTCAITNPMHFETRDAVMAANVLKGHDVYAVEWIKAFRAKQAAEAEAAG